MKCEYCGFEFNAHNCPNCGAFAPQFQIEPVSPNADRYPGRNDNNNNYYSDDYFNHPHPEQYNNYYSGVKVRAISTCIILTFITCGLYSLIWFEHLNNESNYLSREPRPQSGGMAFLLVLLTCGIYYFFWAYKQGVRIDRARTLKGLPPKNMGILYALLLFVPYFGGIVSLSLMQNEINNLAI